MGTRQMLLIVLAVLLLVLELPAKGTSDWKKVEDEVGYAGSRGIVERTGICRAF